jgi:hypothetical protein
MILEAVVVVAVIFAAYKHYSKSAAVAAVVTDVQAAVAKVEAVIAPNSKVAASASSIVATIKADLSKYL